MYNILKKWDISIPEGYESWYESWMEYLAKSYPDKVFAIDELPFSVSMENNDKYAQVELIFQEAKRKKQLLKKFVSTENKYINVFTKLWLYNKFYVGAYLCEDESYYRIESEYRKDYKRLQAKIKQSGRDCPTFCVNF